MKLNLKAKQHTDTPNDSSQENSSHTIHVDLNVVNKQLFIFNVLTVVSLDVANTNQKSITSDA